MDVNEKYLDQLTEAIYHILKGETPSPLHLPPDHPHDELFQVYDYFNRLVHEYNELSGLMYAIARGELDYQAPRGKLKVTQSFKSLQSNLKHLTWITQQIADGDFNQKVDFMGDFSLAFNKMVAQLKGSFKEIEDANLELYTANAEIERYIKNITASIQYASRIQKSLLPSEDEFNAVFNENFIIYCPRDIVSGDFYWIKETPDRILLALADCTGHGVPGAFMSLLGITSLNEITTAFPSYDPARILQLLSDKIEDSLRKNEKSDNKDGMDITFVAFDKKTASLEFAVANHSLFFVRNGELVIYKEKSITIGYNEKRNIRPFINHRLQVDQGDTLYMFSDGIVDQFGGSANRKFSQKKLQEVLLQIHPWDMHQQGAYLRSMLDEWKGGNKQTDDICLIGIRF